MNLFNKAFYTKTDIASMIEEGLVVDGSAGGLVLGRSHHEGGIRMLFLMEDYYTNDMEIEGYEYIMNSAVLSTYESYFDFINQPVEHFVDKNFEDYNPDEKIKKIDCRLLVGSKAIAIGPHKFGIVNRSSTKGFLKTLKDMDDSVHFNKEGYIQILHDNPIDINFYDQFCGSVQGKRPTKSHQ